MTSGSSRRGADKPGAELHSIAGGRRTEVKFGGIRIVAAAEDDPPFDVAAVVAEEDTWLALSADPSVVHPPGHPVRVMTEVWNAKPATPGTVTIRSGNPLQLLAVVHDLNVEPSWRNEWVEAALGGVFSALDKRRLAAVALPFIGTRHGRLPEPTFVGLLRAALARHVEQVAEHGAELFPQRIWLMCNSPRRRELLAELAS